MSAEPQYLSIAKAAKLAGVPYQTGRRRAFAGEWGPLNTKGKRKLVTVAGLAAALGRPLSPASLLAVAKEPTYSQAQLDDAVVRSVNHALRHGDRGFPIHRTQLTPYGFAQALLRERLKGT